MKYLSPLKDWNLLQAALRFGWRAIPAYPRAKWHLLQLAQTLNQNLITQWWLPMYKVRLNPQAMGLLLNSFKKQLTGRSSIAICPQKLVEAFADYKQDFYNVSMTPYVQNPFYLLKIRISFKILQEAVDERFRLNRKIFCIHFFWSTYFFDLK